MVLGFALILVVGTAAVGTVLSLTVGRQLQEVDWSSLVPPDGPAAAVELAIAGALLTWAVVRLRRPEARPPRPDKKNRTGAALLGLGVLFAVTAPLDPTFVALVVLGGRGEPVVSVSLAHLLWILISQLPLVALVVAIALRRHERAVVWMQGLLPRVRPVLARVGTGALLLAGLVLALDAGWWLVTGRFLIGDPG